MLVTVHVRNSDIVFTLTHIGRHLCNLTTQDTTGMLKAMGFVETELHHLYRGWGLTIEVDNAFWDDAVKTSDELSEVLKDQIDALREMSDLTTEGRARYRSICIEADRLSAQVQRQVLKAISMAAALQ